MSTRVNDEYERISAAFKKFPKRDGRSIAFRRASLSARSAEPKAAEARVRTPAAKKLIG
jgi:hypothetical protein